LTKINIIENNSIENITKKLDKPQKINIIENNSIENITCYASAGGCFLGA